MAAAVDSADASATNRAGNGILTTALAIAMILAMAGLLGRKVAFSYDAPETLKKFADSRLRRQGLLQSARVPLSFAVAVKPLDRRPPG